MVHEIQVGIKKKKKTLEDIKKTKDHENKHDET